MRTRWPRPAAAPAAHADEMAVAFEALDRNKSGSLDYEEVVAMLSGTRQLPKA